MDMELTFLMQRIRSLCIIRITAVFNSSDFDKSEEDADNSTLGDCAGNVVTAGTYVVSASHDATLRVWDANTGTCCGVLQGHSGVMRMNIIVIFWNKLLFFVVIHAAC